MRVFISVDMEGVAGVVHAEQTRPAAPEYEQSRRLMTAEANAAIAGARAAGATRIVVSDSHWDMRNLVPDELDPAAELIQGSPRRWSMMEGIDDGFDAACFIGYHGMAGTEASVIDHTYTGSVFDVRINGRPIGEIGLNAALAGHFGVPVACVSGDHTAVAEAKAWLGEDVASVVVKQGLSRYAARSLAPAVARERIREGVAAALRQAREPLRLDGPLTLSIDYLKTTQADIAAIMPGVERTSARTVEYTADDYLTLFRAFRALFLLGGIEA
jgi:D-amino peptidase